MGVNGSTFWLSSPNKIDKISYGSQVQLVLKDK